MPGTGYPVAVPVAAGEKGGGIGSLKAEDGLLDVADREDRARRPARALARKEFLGELLDDLPLLRRGVLRLIDQHVVDTAVQLVKHPGSAAVAVQQPRGGLDQIAVVELSPAVLEFPIAQHENLAEHQQRFARFGRDSGAVPRPDAGQTVRLRPQDLQRAGRSALHFPGSQSLALAGLTFLGEKDGRITLERLRLRRWIGVEPGIDDRRPPALRRRAVGQRGGRAPQAGHIELSLSARVGQYARGRFARRQAEDAPHRFDRRLR